MGANEGVRKGSLAWADLDLDLVLTGHNVFGGSF
jgi:hypothetical protein